MKEKQRFLSFQWIFASLIVVLGVLFMVRLGIWQLDRLKWRQEFNAHYLAQISAEPINLNLVEEIEPLTEMEYREAIVTGKYLFDEEIYLNNQVYDNQPGYFVFTPFLIDGQEMAILINRGWVPLESFKNNLKWNLNNPTQTLHGKIRIDIKEPDFKKNLGTEDGQGRIYFWNYINLDRVNLQNTEELMPIYLDLESSDLASSSYPIILENEVELTQGPHLGYAIQWFFFAALLGLGYPVYVKKSFQKTNERTIPEGENDGK